MPPASQVLVKTSSKKSRFWGYGATGSAGSLQDQGWKFESSYLHISKNSSFGRASAFQAEGGGFEPRFLLKRVHGIS